ncbi:MAG: protein-L-isoaspartate(D-aspartate) O-methyltransferase [Pseudomonadota bacterium]
MTIDRRRALIRDIQAKVEETADWTGRRALKERLLEALAKVPREAFVPAGEAPFADLDEPLPIGHGQTISQPFIVAIMTELLDVEAGATVLEIGTGSGYQAAILAELVSQVYTIETIPALADPARQRLDRLGYKNIEVRAGNGQFGWPERAPFDAVIVTAAAPEIPRHLVRQLKPGGRMVIPVGVAGGPQMLTLVEKTGEGRVSTRDVLPVAFVPLTGDGAPRKRRGAASP